MSEFKVGDKVNVVKDGHGFSTYENFFRENDLTEFESGFKRGRTPPLGDYTVVGNDKGALELIAEPKPIYASDLMTEARKNPEKYEGKRYKVVDECIIKDYDGKTLAKFVIYDGQFFKERRGGGYAYVCSSAKVEEIKPEPKPVPFIEAVKAYSEGKTIRCETGVSTALYESGGLCGYFNEIKCREILNGEWYIEP